MKEESCPQGYCPLENFKGQKIGCVCTECGRLEGRPHLERCSRAVAKCPIGCWCGLARQADPAVSLLRDLQKRVRPRSPEQRILASATLYLCGLVRVGRRVEEWWNAGDLQRQTLEPETHAGGDK